MLTNTKTLVFFWICKLNSQTHKNIQQLSLVCSSVKHNVIPKKGNMTGFMHVNIKVSLVRKSMVFI